MSSYKFVDGLHKRLLIVLTVRFQYIPKKCGKEVRVSFGT